MATTDTPTSAEPGPTRPAEPWYLRDAAEVLAALSSDARDGLTASEASARRHRYGPNELPREAAPSRLQVTLAQARDPMWVMLGAVAGISLTIGQAGTAVFVLALLVLNLWLGANQELKARASVAALADLQVPRARVVRDGRLVELPATDVVPGDLVAVEAGDLVPADGRIVEAASLDVQEAALTGESVLVAKGTDTLDDSGDIPLGDRANMLYQNTSVTRGSGRFVVTATGADTEVGRIATMLGGVRRTRSPLQRELDGLTKRIGWIAWGTLVVILAVGALRGLPVESLLLLGVAMAVSAIPTGLPTFVTMMLGGGARRLAEARAVVRNLTDVETLGATDLINTDKTGTLTLNEMTVRGLYYGDSWYRVEGEGYGFAGQIHGVAGAVPTDFAPLAYVSALASDATVSSHGDVVGDPTEAALVVLAEKMGVSVAETRHRYPRVATVPFDSDYKFMATFHELPLRGETRLVGLVKGGPDVLLARCTQALAGEDFVAVDDVVEHVRAANERLGSMGLRVLALAARVMDPADRPRLEADPMGEVRDLVFLGLAGIIDPLRPEAVEAVRRAHDAGIDVRMITGDHLVTAQAIARELGLPPGGMTGAELRSLADDELAQRLPHSHVFARVSPQDKLRLVQVMQMDDSVVAMTGDAVNDAAALKQADIGVAMGSGSEVSKQAAKMVLTDDNFATLVDAVELGRNVYERISRYVGYQLVQLFGLVLMFLLATAFDVNGGVAMLPLQALFINFTFASVPVIVIATDDTDPALMRQPPRRPDARILNRTTGARWGVFGLVLGGLALLPVAFGPGDAATEGASVPVTMGYVTMALGTALSALVLRRPPAPAWEQPVQRALLWTLGAVGVVFLTTELRFLQTWLSTTALSPQQWLVCGGLAATFGLVVEAEKWRRRRPRHSG